MAPGQGTFVETGAGCPAVVSGSGDARAWTDNPLPSRSTDAVHALKVFKRGDLETRGTGCPIVVQF